MEERPMDYPSTEIFYQILEVNEPEKKQPPMNPLDFLDTELEDDSTD